jgi:hypothetical protein
MRDHLCRMKVLKKLVPNQVLPRGVRVSVLTHLGRLQLAHLGAYCVCSNIAPRFAAFEMKFSPVNLKKKRARVEPSNCSDEGFALRRTAYIIHSPYHLRKLAALGERRYYPSTRNSPQSPENWLGCFRAFHGPQVPDDHIHWYSYTYPYQARPLPSTSIIARPCIALHLLAFRLI